MGDKLKNQEIIDVYNLRDSVDKNNFKNDLYYFYTNFERYKIIFKNLYKQWGNYLHYKDKKLLEIGAGTGNNLLEFWKLGFEKENIFANEINPNRYDKLLEKIDVNNIFLGDALDIETEEKFDVILVSTVFTSILDCDLKNKIAIKMFDLLNKGGLIIWYDFRYNNPNNKNVKAISKKEIKKLFPKSNKSIFYNITLAPPIGRSLPTFYSFLNLMPFLRTHILAIIHKKNE